MVRVAGKQSIFIVAAASAAAILTGCGGSGGGPGTTPDPVSFTVMYKGTASSAVGYQEGASAWKVATATAGSNNFNISVPTASNKFSVAAREGSKTTVYMSTKDEDLTFGDPFPTYTNDKTYNITGLPAGSSTLIHQYYVQSGPYTVNGSFTLPKSRPNVTWDAVADVATADIANSHFIFARNLSGGASATPIDISYTGSNSYLASPVDFIVPRTPTVVFVTKNLTQVPLNSVDTGTATRFYAPPVSALVSEDRFVLTSSATDSVSGGATSVRTCTTTSPRLTSTPTPVYPAALTGYSVESINSAKGVYKINFTPVVGAKYYKVVLTNSGANSTTLYVSPAYLGAGTSIVTPDLSSMHTVAPHVGAFTKVSITAGFTNLSFADAASKLRASSVANLSSISLGAGIVLAESTISNIATGD